jgi:hypothetical protein
MVDLPLTAVSHQETRNYEQDKYLTQTQGDIGYAGATESPSPGWTSPT